MNINTMIWIKTCLVCLLIGRNKQVNAFRSIPFNGMILNSGSISTTLLNVKSVAKSNKDSRSKVDSSNASRMKRTNAFTNWALSQGIKVGGLEIASSSPTSGLGLFATQTLNPSDLLIQVPSKLALSVPTKYDSKIKNLFPKKEIYEDAPWWVQLAIQLIVLDNKLITSNKDDSSIYDINVQPWLDSLPRSFSTPIHWSESTLSDLQYPFLIQSIQQQKSTWKIEYDKILQSNAFPSSFTYSQFVWACECARSRAFSGSYAGSAFNPTPYAFTLLLITIYVGFNLGTLEQAANGAALVVCATIWKDFVLPKLTSGQQQRYVICPFIDMANHVGINEAGNVAFEYFSDSYSLAVKSLSLSKKEQLMISYGPRSNDQLLQYYGFVEKDNVHDVYVMPPLREWDISAMENACKRSFSSGRLQKLERAGLLGFSSTSNKDESIANRAGGVVLTRAVGIDPAVLQALRALVSSDEEWQDAGEAVGNFASEKAGGDANENAMKLAAKAALQMELNSKETTIEEDEQLLQTAKNAKSKNSMLSLSEQETLAVQFRLEKKKLLKEIIDSL